MNAINDNSTLTAALAWHAADCAVVPVAVDGTKAPSVPWKSYQAQPPPRDQVESWFASEHPGIGVLCGAASGNLEMLELEGRAVTRGMVDAFRDALDDDDLFTRVSQGYVELSPSGGTHYFFRVSDAPVSGNRKLARTQDDDGTIHPLIETRGEGGFVVVAPSHGAVHETQQRWWALCGSPDSIPTISSDERDALHGAARMLDQMPPPEPIPDREPSTLTPGECSPGDDYSHRGSWQELLERHGWTVVQNEGNRTLWTRPGKSRGISAATGGDHGDYLFVWSTSTELPSETGLSLYRAYAMLDHGGDFSAAASELRRQGYGSPSSGSQSGSLPTVTLGSATTPETGDGGDSSDSAAITGTESPDTFFAKSDGLQVDLLAKAVLAKGPLAAGVDDLWWHYDGGVWKPHKHIISNRAALLLGRRWRPMHGRAVESYMRALLPTITCEPVEEYINFRNGLLHWRKGTLVDHDPSVMSTVQLNVDYDPNATCPQFDAFLSQVVPEDAIPLVWELLGYMLYSGNPLHKAVMLVGSGRNGKGTLLRVLKQIIGNGNFTAVSLHDLVNTRFSAANLFGKLANIAGDIDAKYIEHTALFKAITGGDSISAEHKGRDRFDFTPWAVPVFSANKIPPSADTTAGYLSRWLIVPFPNSFTGREDRTLDERLNGEVAGIAAKAVAHLPPLLRRGDFELPQSAIDAHNNFEKQVDQVKMWLDECCHIDSSAWTPRTRLYDAYKQWASRDGHKAVKASEFYDRLAGTDDALIEPATVNGTRGFKGLQVVDAAILSLAPAGPIAAPHGRHGGDGG